jgi:exopolyphosphatase / guanosine-5'-triphosphate,3'-diphosphate pyrophosphatase
MKRIAVIDCGTNTFNLLISEVLGIEQLPKKIFSTRFPVKLGQNGIQQHIIAPAPYKRGMDALNEFHKLIIEYDAKHILAFATSAIRDADNGKQFVQEAWEQFQIPIRIIDGDEEAQLIYEGNKRAVKLSDKLSLVMDIGGGSTEFILCNQHQLFWKQSFQLGAARLLEKFKPSDPITESELQAINLYLKNELVPLTSAIKKYGQVNELIGSSGAFDSIIDMIHGELNGEPLIAGKTEYIISLENYTYISNKVVPSSYQQRQQINGLIEMRVDMIVISCLLIDAIIQNYTIPNFTASTYSLKEGALFSFIEGNGFFQRGV